MAKFSDNFRFNSGVHCVADSNSPTLLPNVPEVAISNGNQPPQSPNHFVNLKFFYFQYILVRAVKSWNLKNLHVYWPGCT